MPWLDNAWLVYTAKHFLKDPFMEKSLNASMLSASYAVIGLLQRNKLHNLNSAHL
jgi:hypothetical protein